MQLSNFYGCGHNCLLTVTLGKRNKSSVGRGRLAGAIIASIRQEIMELRGFFPSFKLLFVGRLANEAAHCCARKASSLRRRCLWVNYTPPFLADILSKDYNPVT
jgi:hypothetical protein